MTPKIQQVYSFELNFIEALRRILSFKDVQTLAFGDDATKRTPRIEIDFSVQSVNPTDRGNIDNGKQQYLSRYSGIASVRIYTSKDTPTHFYLVGSTRSRLSYLGPKLIKPTLPYYQVERVFEQASRNGLSDDDDREIITELTFAIDWVIPREAFFDTEGYLLYNGMRVTFNGVPLTYNFEPIEPTQTTED